MDYADSLAGLCRDQPDKFLEAECLWAYGIDDFITLLVDSVDDQIRHIAYEDRPHPVAAIAGNREDRKMTHEPGDIVDKDIFFPEDDRRAQDCVGKTRTHHYLL